MNTPQSTKKIEERIHQVIVLIEDGVDDSFNDAIQGRKPTYRTKATQQFLTILKETLEEALPENPYRIPDGSTAKSLEAPAHAFDVAIDQTKANLAKLIGEDNESNA